MRKRSVHAPFPGIPILLSCAFLAAGPIPVGASSGARPAVHDVDRLLDRNLPGEAARGFSALPDAGRGRDPVLPRLLRSLADAGKEDTALAVFESARPYLVEPVRSPALLGAGKIRWRRKQTEAALLLFAIIRLGDTLVREIMVPRIDILALDVNIPIQQAADALIESGHSRVPVYQDSVDTVLGLLYAKDLLRIWREGNQIKSLRDLLREAYFVPEAKKVDELLEELQSRRIHIAIVVDEYGGVSGLVTLEDIVEEIVGEIRDEYDQSEELLVQAINADEYVFHGRIDLDDFNDLMGTELPRSEADTLGGFIFNHIGHVPATGDKVWVDHIELTIEQISGQRIRKVRAQRITPSTKNGVNDPHVDG